MKKIVSLVVITVLAAGILLAILFYWRHLRGVWPLVKPLQKDITDVIEKEGIPLTLPEGFSISLFAKGLEKPRVLIRDNAGSLLVSIPSQGTVVALPDRDRDGIADETITVISGLNRPHGLAMRCTQSCELYVAESDQVAVYDYDEEKLKAENKRTLVSLPNGGNHFTRTILFLPSPNEDELLISVGSSCNVCNEKDWRRAKILVADVQSGEVDVYASGLRNAVFMASHPVTGKVWVTEMGRDLLGDDIPPDEINILVARSNYGWPLCYGKNILDSDFHEDNHVHIRGHCEEPFEIGSYIDIPAHSSPLGLAFVPKDGWPEAYKYNLFVAEHGSWNRSEPSGYKIVRYILDKNGVYQEKEDFITGWLTADNDILGRPVAILAESEGVLFISDDKAGVIYKVMYTE